MLTVTEVQFLAVALSDRGTRPIYTYRVRILIPKIEPELSDQTLFTPQGNTRTTT